MRKNEPFQFEVENLVDPKNTINRLIDEGNEIKESLVKKIPSLEKADLLVYDCKLRILYVNIENEMIRRYLDTIDEIYLCQNKYCLKRLFNTITQIDPETCNFENKTKPTSCSYSEECQSTLVNQSEIRSDDSSSSKSPINVRLFSIK